MGKYIYKFVNPGEAKRKNISAISHGGESVKVDWSKGEPRFEFAGDPIVEPGAHGLRLIHADE